MREILAALLVISVAGMVVWGAVLFDCYDEPDRIKVREKRAEYVQKGEMNYTAFLAPNVIYGKEELSKGEGVVYTNLMKEMWVEYSYEITNCESLSGTYVMRTFLYPSETRNAPSWEKELPFTVSGSFNGKSWSESIKLDWGYVLNLWKTIQEETGYRYGKPAVRFDVDVKVDGYAGGTPVHDKFSHTMSVVYDKSLIFENMEKDEVKGVFAIREVENTVDVFGVDTPVSSARTVAIAGFVLSSISAVSLTYVMRGDFKDAIAELRAKRRLSEFRRKYGNMIVGVDIRDNGAIVLKDIKDMGKLAFELEKPILETEKDYRVIDGERLYMCMKTNKSGENNKN
ncbi:DUF5305 family protein [Archaeoglobus veneficus]|uniref:DUF5305 domain-containing protein n=1 Tax=Archaeoglobus veneficus (strain DSM 11195 / SNP6) TaxID=693661 RepID=F2KNU8_ARCVS|nr:DUF5305 family protein [Archaeoglobus veneficus]AEA47425.1 hypothetical protein Arcve_1422 [Archaeoglobus veneficus SNP6]